VRCHNQCNNIIEEKTPKELIWMLELEQFKQEIESLGENIEEMGASL